MSSVSEYYQNEFEKDLTEFFSTIPDDSRFHHGKSAQTIQYDRLTNAHSHLDFLSVECKVNFGVCLFFIVLTDMVCYTYLKPNYLVFQSLTHYPKLIGICPGGCHYHLDPKNIFHAMNKDCNEPRFFEYNQKLRDSVAFFEDEVTSILKRKQTRINRERFWELIKNHLPSSS